MRRRATGWMEEKEEVTRAERPLERVRACDSRTLLRTHRFASGRLILLSSSYHGKAEEISYRNGCGEMTWKIGGNAPSAGCRRSPSSLFHFRAIFVPLLRARSSSRLSLSTVSFPPSLGLCFSPDDFYFHPRDPHSLTMKIARLFAIDHYPDWSPLRTHSPRVHPGKATRFQIRSLPLALS